jgi:hypothetical protein
VTVSPLEEPLLSPQPISAHDHSAVAGEVWGISSWGMVTVFLPQGSVR